MASKDSRLKADQIHQACDSVRARGERVTTNSVYDELGQRGSFSTIQNHIKTWEELHSEELGKIKNLPLEAAPPESLNVAVNNLTKTIWNVAKGMAAVDFDSEREAFKEAEAEMNLKLADIAAFSEQQADTIEVLRKQIAEIQGLLDKAEASNKELNELNIAKKDELIEVERERDIANLEIKNLNDQLKKMVDEYHEFKSSANGEIKQLRNEIDDINKAHEVAMEAAKNKAFAEIKQLTEKLGKATAAAELNAVELANLKVVAQENKKLEREVQKLQINLDATVISLNELKIEVKEAFEGEKAANRRADLLEGELHAFKLTKK